MKIKYIQHLFKIFVELGNKENLVILTRKLLRLSKGSSEHSTAKLVTLQKQASVEDDVGGEKKEEGKEGKENIEVK